MDGWMHGWMDGWMDGLESITWFKPKIPIEVKF
jgi:hypothetical protein